MDTFDAFISYRYDSDAAAAVALQRGLERLARPWNQVRALRVFRDRTGLTANPELWSSIAGALDGSAWLVLLCSPGAADSPWVGREIEHWFTRHDASHILLALADGRIAWDPARADFDHEKTTAIPNALFGRYAAEPRYVDLRWARERQDLDLGDPEFRAAVAELAAPIHGLDRAELHHEDLRRTRRARRLARGGVSILVVLTMLSAALAGVAFQQRNRAEANARRAQAETVRATNEANRAKLLARQLVARQLVASSTDTRTRGDLVRALLLAATAARLQPSLEAQGALLAALVAQPAARGFIYGLGAAPTRIEYSPDGSVLAAVTERGLQLWDMTTRRALPVDARIPAPANEALQLAFRPDGKVLAVAIGDRLLFVSAVTGRIAGAPLELPRIPIPSVGTTDVSNNDVVWSPSGDRLAIVRSARTFERLDSTHSRDTAQAVITTFDMKRRVVLASIDLGSVDPFSPSALAFSPDGSILATEGQTPNVDPTDTASEVRTFRSDTGESDSAPLASHTEYASGYRLTFDDARTLSSLAIGASGAAIRVFDLDAHSAKDEDLVPSGLRAPSTNQGIIAVSADNRYIATQSDDGTIHLWSTQTGVELGSSVGAVALVPMSFGSPAAFSPDGETLAVANKDTAIHLFATDPIPAIASRVASPLEPAGLWEPDLGALPCNERYGPAARSRDGRWYAFACRSIGANGTDLIRGVLGLWDTRTRSLHARWPVFLNGDYPSSIAFSPDGRTVAVTSAGGHSDRGWTEVFATDTGAALHKAFVSTNYVGGVAFSPDGRFVTWSERNRVRIWDRVNGKMVALSPVAGEPAASLTVSADSRRLVAANSLGVSLWDVGSEAPIGGPLATYDASPLLGQFAQADLSIDSHDETMTELVRPLDPDRGQAGPVRIALRWTLGIDSLVDTACSIANRNLTSAERRQYLPGIAAPTACPGVR